MVEYGKNRYVADIKLPHINNISELARKAKKINRIVLFGSSLEERCKSDSDIDIAVFGSLSKNRYIDSAEFRAFKSGLFSFDRNQDYDVLYFKEDTECHDAIMDEINEGVEIYRRVAN